MASSRNWYTSDEVVAFFRATESSNEEDEQAEETFLEYIGFDLTYLQDEESLQELTDKTPIWNSKIHHTIQNYYTKDTPLTS